MDQIHEYVSQFSIGQANRLILSLVDSARQLELFPESGRVIPEYATDLREIISGAYRIQYRINGQSIEVLAVVHCAQVLPVVPPEFE